MLQARICLAVGQRISSLAPTGGPSTTFEWVDSGGGFSNPAPTLSDPSYVFAPGVPGTGLTGQATSLNIELLSPGPFIGMAGTVATWGDAAIDPFFLPAPAPAPVDAFIPGPRSRCAAGSA